MFDSCTETQKAIVLAVRAFCKKNISQYQTEEYFGTIPHELHKSLSALGLCGLAIEEEFGGLNGGALTSAMVFQEISTFDLGPAIFLSVHAMVSGILRRHGSSSQKKKFLPSFASGEKLCAFALTEPHAGSDAAALRTTATKQPDGSYLIKGEKCYITSAGFADYYLVFARNPESVGKEGISAFIVEKEAPHLHIASPDKKMGCELSPIASITFDGVTVQSENLIGAPGEGYKVALSGLAGGRVNIAACANGLSRAAIDAATTHLKNRSQFGTPLSEFQGLQFMLADMKILLEASELLTWQAAQSLEGTITTSESKIYPSLAKCHATDAAMKITTDAVQLLGGAGYLKDYGVEKLMRDAKMLQIVEGTNQIQRAVIAREMLKG